MLNLPLSPEVVYATKNNIAAPVGSVAATIAAAAELRMEDLVNAFKNPNETALAITINADNVQVANQ